MKKIKIKVTDKESAIRYIKRVLKKWKKFCEGHPQFEKALEILIDN